jgi:hypothetical protein
MPGEDMMSWSKIAANNASADTSINWAEGEPRAAVNDSARSMMAAEAKNRDLRNGSITTTGTATSYGFTSGVAYTVMPTGLFVRLKIHVTSTGGPTFLNMDAIGAIGILNQAGLNVRAGELVANTYAEFIYNGTNWILLNSGVGTVAGINIILLTASSGTYTPTPGLRFAVVECIGGGGGGGNVIGATGLIFGGGGGGSGGYSRSVLTAATIGASQPYAVGAGGSPGSPGANGGAASFGSGGLVSANGGQGGDYAGTAAHSGFGGAGGGISGAAGQLIMPGNPGQGGIWNAQSGTNITAAIGTGASSFYGGGAASALYNQIVASPGGYTGLNAGGYGSGGSGAIVLNFAAGYAGGSGSNGVIIVNEYM